MAKDARASPPYERVPNFSQYTFNNLFISSALFLKMYEDTKWLNVISN